jgi:hypothetical protein
MNKQEICYYGKYARILSSSALIQLIKETNILVTTSAFGLKVCILKPLKDKKNPYPKELIITRESLYPLTYDLIRYFEQLYVPNFKNKKSKTLYKVSFRERNSKNSESSLSEDLLRVYTALLVREAFWGILNSGEISR